MMVTKSAESETLVLASHPSESEKSYIHTSEKAQNLRTLFRSRSKAFIAQKIKKSNIMLQARLTHILKQ